jgi:hypothetical protein
VTARKRGPQPGPVLTAREKGELAERMVPEAIALACAVRDGEAGEIAALIGARTRQELMGLLVVMAAMVPVDQPVSDLLDWVTWDETGRPLPGTTPMLPQMPLTRAERRREFCRLRAEGLTLPAAARATESSLRTASRYEDGIYEDDEATSDAA